MLDKNNFFSQKKNWSKLKDEILKNYLKPYLAKISKTNKPITIIDCFAGKGKFDDGTIGSPIIIMEEINRFKSKNPWSQIKTIFIESKYCNDLKFNLKDYKDISIFEGTFEENITKILSIDARSNLFIYIDPYGIKSLDFAYFSDFTKKGFSSLEILLNFNSIGFLREACRVLNYYNLILTKELDEDYEIEDSLDVSKMSAIANGNYWKEIIHDFKNKTISFYEAEEKFTKLYTEKLNSLFKYLNKIPIKTKIRNIPKYRIIFGTNHPDGLILMSENMNKTWKSMVEEDRKGQGVLFNEYDFYTEGIESIERKIIETLLENKFMMNLKDLYVELIKIYGFQFSYAEYKNKIKELEANKLIEIIRYPKVTKTGKICESFDYNNYRINIKLKKNEIQ
jgi:three-Cys-motif partner protein